MRILLVAWGMAAASVCYGHGNPIHVDVVNGGLVVSGGLPTLSGFASMAFDDNEDAYLDIAPGFKLGSTLPGFYVSDMSPSSQLNLEVMPRPDFTDPSIRQRWMWFWDEATQRVGVADDDPTLELASERLLGSILLTQFVPPATGETMKVMEPLASDLETHQHPILYLLDDLPAAKPGAYGLFAHLTSPDYASSAPFLIALNYGLSPESYQQAAKAINSAARLPGDYDGDEDVDGADFMLWQQTLGSTTALAADGSLSDQVDDADLSIWLAGLGSSSPAGVNAIPEPSGVAIGLGAIACLMMGAAAGCLRAGVRAPHWR